MVGLTADTTSGLNLSFIDKSLNWNRQSKPPNFLPPLSSYLANLLQVKLVNRTCVHWYMYIKQNVGVSELFFQ